MPPQLVLALQGFCRPAFVCPRLYMRHCLSVREIPSHGSMPVKCCRFYGMTCDQKGLYKMLTIVGVCKIHRIVQQPVHDFISCFRRCFSAEGALQVCEILHGRSSLSTTLHSYFSLLHLGGE